MLVARTARVLHMVTPPEIRIKKRISQDGFLQATFANGYRDTGAGGWGRDSPTDVTLLTTPKVSRRDGARRGRLLDCVSRQFQ